MKPQSALNINPLIIKNMKNQTIIETAKITNVYFLG